MRGALVARLRLGFYWLSHVVVGTIFRVLWRIEAIDNDKIPLDGPLIIACNHIAYLDPPALGVAATRPISYMAKHELFDIFFLGPLIRLLYAFPVDRSRGDIGAMKTALGVLKTGRCLGIFPEGTRNKGTEPLEPGLGVALLASWSGAPVVPAYVTGTSQAKKFAKITVRFGDPLLFEAGRKASREDLAKWTHVLIERIYQLRETTAGREETTSGH